MKMAFVFFFGVIVGGGWRFVWHEVRWHWVGMAFIVLVG